MNAARAGVTRRISWQSLTARLRNTPVARWIRCDDAKKLEEFREKNAMNLALDAAGHLVYLAPTRVNLQLAQERAPDVQFLATREHAHAVAID